MFKYDTSAENSDKLKIHCISIKLREKKKCLKCLGIMVCILTFIWFQTLLLHGMCVHLINKQAHMMQSDSVLTGFGEDFFFFFTILLSGLKLYTLSNGEHLQSGVS